MHAGKDVTAKFDAQQIAAEREARCECGQLIAKLRRDGVELKCKRCKRIVVIPYSRRKGDEVSNNEVRRHTV